MEGLPIEPIEFLKPENLPPNLRSQIRYQSFLGEQTLFSQGEPASYFYVVESGRIRLDRYMPSGKFVTFQIARPGEGFSISSLFDEMHEYNATSEEPSRVIMYPKQTVLDALSDYPEFAQELMYQLLKNMCALRIRLELREIRIASDRILYYLQSIAKFSGTTVSFERPFRMVALDLGLTPEVFYRTLAQLEKEGMISREKRQITLHETPAA
jgi:CRP-like cAMP-binding protein